MKLFFKQQHRALLSQLMSLEVRVAKDCNDRLFECYGLSRYGKLNTEVTTYVGFHFGIYCMLKATEILRIKLFQEKQQYINEEDYLIRRFVDQHRNVCTLNDVAKIFNNNTSHSWKRHLGTSCIANSYLDQADKLIEKHYACLS